MHAQDGWYSPCSEWTVPAPCLEMCCLRLLDWRLRSAVTVLRSSWQSVLCSDDDLGIDLRDCAASCKRLNHRGGISRIWACDHIPDKYMNSREVLLASGHHKSTSSHSLYCIALRHSLTFHHNIHQTLALPCTQHSLHNSPTTRSKTCPPGCLFQ